MPVMSCTRKVTCRKKCDGRQFFSTPRWLITLTMVSADLARDVKGRTDPML
jgi:hypothetical protein